jgi:predicted metal-binding membrane protein
MTDARVPLRSAHAPIVGLMLVLAAACWTIVSAWMGSGGGQPGAAPGPLGFFLVVWTLMMAAMMFPSIWPTVLVYRRLQATKRERGAGPVPLGSALLVAGYLAAWAAAGLVGFVILFAGHAAEIDALNWDRGGPLLAGGVIIAAAIYQLTPLKDLCLRHCRGPFSFLLEHWHPGPLGAVRMGARHGVWCIGCCVALMASLFALGVMSVLWMAVIAVLIALEKLLPWRRTAMTVVTATLLLIGLAVAVAPDQVPGLMGPGGEMRDDSTMEMSQ